MELFSFILVLLAIGQFITQVRTTSWKAALSDVRLGLRGLVLVFLGWVIFSALTSDGSPELKIKSLRSMVWVVHLYCFTYLLRHHLRPQWEKHFRWIFLSMGVASIYTIFQTFMAIDLIRKINYFEPMGSLWRGKGFFTNPLTFAYAAGFSGLAITAYFFVVGSSRWKWGRLVAGITGVLHLLAQLASGSRGAYVALIPALALLTRLVSRRVFWMSVGGGVIFLALVFAFQPDVFHRTTSISDIKESSNAGRFKIWKVSWNMFADHPIKGIGLNQNVRLMNDYYFDMGVANGQIGHAHNNVLQFLVGTGVPGALLFIALSLTLLWISFRAWKTWPADGDVWLRSLILASLTAQVFFHVGGLTEANFFDGEVRHNLILAWSAALALSIKGRKP